MTPGKQTRRGKITRFVGMRRAVRNLDRAIAFYTVALGFSVTDEASATSDSRGAQLTLGSESIYLYCPDQWCQTFNDDSVNATISNTAFQHIAIVTQEMRESIKRLHRFDPAFISDDGAVQLPQGAGGVTACKFLDPDDHPLELVSFPAGVGNPKWQSTIEHGPNLGIDHSAMSVVDIDRSIAFYVDGLGLKVASRHLNQGRQQAHLDGVNEAVVDVVALASCIQATPHLELLGYRVPVAQQRKIPASISQDHADQLLFRVDDVASLMANLHLAYRKHEFDTSQTGSGSVLLRDFDGHLLHLRQSFSIAEENRASIDANTGFNYAMITTE